MLTRGVFASYDSHEQRRRSWRAFTRRPFAEFLAGEEALARDAWVTAERHYVRAFQLDSGFVLAGWRLGNVRRWLPLDMVRRIRPVSSSSTSDTASRCPQWTVA